MKRALLPQLSLLVVLLLALGGCADYVDDLDSPDPTARLEAIHQCGEKGDLSTVNKLVFFLGEEDHRIADASEKALLKMGVKAVPLLMNHLRIVPEGIQRERIVSVLLKAGTPAAQYVVNFLDTPDKDFKEEVRTVLLSYGLEGVPHILISLKEGSLVLRKEITEVLIPFGDPVVPYLLEAMDERTPATFMDDSALVVLKIGESAVSRLIPLLASADAAKRKRVEVLLGKVAMDYPELVAGALGSENKAISEGMNRILFGLGDSSNALLQDMLLYPQETVRVQALNLLERKKWTPIKRTEEAKVFIAKGEVQQGYDLLLKLFRQEVTRSEATSILATLGNRVCQYLEPTLQDRDNSLRADSLRLMQVCDCPGLDDRMYRLYYLDDSDLVKAAALEVILAREKSVTDFLAGLPAGDRALIVENAIEKEDLLTLSEMLRIFPEDRRAPRIRKLIRQRMEALEKKQRDYSIPRIRQRQLTDVPRLEMLTGEGYGHFKDRGGTYKMVLERPAGPQFVMVVVEKGEFAPKAEDSDTQYYRYRLGLIPRYTAPLGMQTVEGKISIYRINRDPETGKEINRTKLIHHTFVQDIEVLENESFEPTDVYLYYLMARYDLDKIKALKGRTDPVSTAQRERLERRMRKYKTFLLDFSKSRGETVAGRGMICLKMLEIESP